MKKWILDAGPIVALLVPTDPAHALASEVIGRFRGSFITTGPVVTEAFHHLRRHPGGPEDLLEFVEASGTTVVECCQPRDLRSAVRLMSQYRDTPMDFADASLVLLAGLINQDHICTLDRRGFKTFRTPSGKRFTLVMDSP